jgi:hypothetical protein
MGSSYIYIWLRADGTPYYVGKGTGRRAYQNSGRVTSGPKDRSRIIIKECFSETEAFEMEKVLIALYGRKDLGTGCLRNLTEGGDCGPDQTGTKHSEQTRLKMSLAGKGKPKSQEHRQALAIILKRARSMQGAASEETRRKMALAHLGKPVHSEEFKTQLSERMKGNKIFLGRTHSEEARRKVSEAKKAYWAEARRAATKKAA